jgi:hypothetical protein
MHAKPKLSIGALCLLLACLGVAQAQCREPGAPGTPTSTAPVATNTLPAIGAITPRPGAPEVILDAASSHEELEERLGWRALRSVDTAFVPVVLRRTLERHGETGSWTLRETYNAEDIGTQVFLTQRPEQPLVPAMPDGATRTIGIGGFDVTVVAGHGTAQARFRTGAMAPNGTPILAIVESDSESTITRFILSLAFN